MTQLPLPTPQLRHAWAAPAQLCPSPVLLLPHNPGPGPGHTCPSCSQMPSTWAECALLAGVVGQVSMEAPPAHCLSSIPSGGCGAGRPGCLGSRTGSGSGSNSGSWKEPPCCPSPSPAACLGVVGLAAHATAWAGWG